MILVGYSYTKQPTHSNAYALALFLEGHDMVRKVTYPGLPSHPQHQLAKRQQHGFGSMITFYCQGGREQAAVILQNVSLNEWVHECRHCGNLAGCFIVMSS